MINYDNPNLFQNALNKSVPIEEKFIRISCVYSLKHLFYNFKFKTPNQEAYTCICTALGNTDNLWKFIEYICSDNFDNTTFLSEQEGPESILLAQKINNEKIRFTIFNDRWMKHYWDEEFEDYKFEAQHTTNYNMEIVLDVILNKKDFIYTFYLELYSIFYGSNVESGAFMYDKAQTDSEIIKNYLGYIPATKQDLELENLLKTGDLEKIETALKNGANPNAVKEIELSTGNKELIIDEALKGAYVDHLYSPHIMGKEVENLSDEEIEEIERKLEPYKEELLLHNFEIIKLLLKYGAKPISLIDAIYCYYSSKKINLVQYLLDNNCEYDDETIGFVCSDYQMEEDFTESEKRTFEKYCNLFDEYLFQVSYQIDYDPTMPQQY